MSHFTVLAVLGPDIDPTDLRKVEARCSELLAPYDENMEAEPRRVYEHQEILGHAVYSARVNEALPGRPDSPSRGVDSAAWEDYRAKRVEYGERAFAQFGGKALAAMMSSDGEDYGWDEDQQSLYRVTTYNPESKWDWWVIGGRWRGYFTPKSGAEGLVGESGVFGNDPGPGKVDVIRVKDIDFEAMGREVLAEREQNIEQVKADPGKAWLYLPEDIDATKEGWEQKYLERPVNIATYAWVSKDGWFERGKMGWFGMGSNEEDEATWSLRHTDGLRKLDPETTVAVIDCHI